jgi:hypothetical protein
MEIISEQIQPQPIVQEPAFSAPNDDVVMKTLEQTPEFVKSSSVDKAQQQQTGDTTVENPLLGNFEALSPAINAPGPVQAVVTEIPQAPVQVAEEPTLQYVDSSYLNFLAGMKDAAGDIMSAVNVINTLLAEERKKQGSSARARGITSLKDEAPRKRASRKAASASIPPFLKGIPSEIQKNAHTIAILSELTEEERKSLISHFKETVEESLVANPRESRSTEIERFSPTSEGKKAQKLRGKKAPKAPSGKGKGKK